MIEWLGDVLLGMKVAWCSPEFFGVRYALAGGIVGSVIGYLARMDGKHAAALDERDQAQEEVG